MGKLLQLLILGFIAWVAFRVLAGKPPLPGRTPDRSDSPAPGPTPGATGGVMRRCAYCNVHVPEGESSQSRGHFFCCEAHRDAYFREQR
jgi:uncharacterized protein